MKKVLLILALGLINFVSAQQDRHPSKPQPLRFPPPPVLVDSGGVTGVPGSDHKKLDMTETGGSGGVSVGGGKKLDGVATGETGGGVKVPSDGKKLDIFNSGDPIIKGSNDKKLDFDTGGGTLPGGGGKKYEVVTGETGGRGQSIDPGKKYDVYESGGSSAGLSNGSGMGKKSDFI